MNWRAGLFRTWLLFSILWVAGVGFNALTSFWKPYPFQGAYQYNMQTKEMPWNTDWTKPLYEIAYAPGKGKFPDEFSEVPENLVETWDKSKDLVRIEMPDNSTLYLSIGWSDADKNLLSKMFWEQRWHRYANKVMPWIGWVLLPPFGFLLIGFAIAWIGRGFRKSKVQA